MSETPELDVLQRLLEASPFAEMDALHEQTLCLWCFGDRPTHADDCPWLAAERLTMKVSNRVEHLYDGPQHGAIWHSDGTIELTDPE